MKKKTFLQTKIFRNVIEMQLKNHESSSKEQNAYDCSTAQKIKLSVSNFFRKCDKIRSFLRIWSHLLKKSLMKNFIFCTVQFLLPNLDFKLRSKMYIFYHSQFNIVIATQPAITCSKLTIETIEHQKAIGIVLMSLLLILNIFMSCSSISIINFEQVNSGWTLLGFST